MPKVIISTVGTSLLTNQINRAEPQEKDWYSKMRDAANLSEEKTPDDVKQIIDILQNRAGKKLEEANIAQIRRASAELNGIYGVYQEDLNRGREDIHFLIATDTMQGKTTAEIVEDFLKEQGIYNTSVKAPKDLSTASTGDFSLGIDDLIYWLQDTIPPLKESQYKVIFNLVGSFKSLQGYLNTIGMFYADEIIYIFEGGESDLISIPRLPIAVDTSLIKPYTIQLALIEAGAEPSVKETKEIPEAMLAEIDGKMMLSTWGKLIWEKCKGELLSNELFQFPHLKYRDSFRADYNKIREAQVKVKLQETLAKVSHLLQQNKGDISILKKDGGLQYDKYTNKGDIDHFRVTQGIRISCHSEQGTLILRRYGKEPDVNRNPE